MRGTHDRLRPGPQHRGIIPAHAGNTWGLARAGVRERDHPRACGEHIDCISVVWLLSGSSPRMRGTRYHQHPKSGIPGIIPAHAGNTIAASLHRTRHRDHPRACGEHCSIFLCCLVLRGSSPRMRGTPLGVAGGSARAGIIPAHAGNTSQCAAFFALFRDHPRACGEHALLLIAFIAFRGSSPRMRGTR